VRWLSILFGLALLAVAFVAATRVENSRQGLIAEVILYLGAVTGLVLLFYGLFARRRPSKSVLTQPRDPRASEPKVPTANDLVLGGAGIVLAIVLLSGLAINGGMLWAVFGFVLLLPMVVGSFYLCLRFLRAPSRDWRVELRPFRDPSHQKKQSEHDQGGRPDDVPVDEPEVVGEGNKTNDDQDHAERY
jgi:hypothetical protein